MDLDEIAPIPASNSLKQRLLDALAVSALSYPQSKLNLWDILAFESASSTMDLANLFRETDLQQTASLTNCVVAIADSIGSESAALSKNPIAILALEQHRGRGREGRIWHSSSQGGIYATFLLFPNSSPERILGLSLGVGLAIARFLEELGISSGLKWPNDVLVRATSGDGLRKIAGVLVEASGSSTTINSISVGIGLNLNQTVFPPEVPGISIFQLTGERIDLATAFVGLAKHVVEVLDLIIGQGFGALLDEYNSRSLIKGAVVRSSASDIISGVAGEVLPDGGLSVSYANSSGETSSRTIYSGEIIIEQYPGRT